MRDGGSADDTRGHAEDLIRQGRPGEAAEFLRGRIDSGRGGLLARILFVRALIASDAGGEALAVAQEIARSNPGVAPAAAILGEALVHLAMPAPAIAEFQRALRLDAEFVEARFRLGEAWLTAGEPEKAMAAFDAIPDGAVEGLSGRIAEAHALRQAPRSAPGYVRHLFDQFSVDYDERMTGQLSYRAPGILRELAEFTIPGRENLAVLDLGCGTGLAGRAFKDLAARLDGIDLSPQMIAKAKSLGIYDNLAVADIETALKPGGPRYDLVLAADTLVYLGDLEAVFEGVSARLNTDGAFLFTVESKDGEGFELGPKRRWRHSDPYLREIGTRNGLTVAGLLQCTPRTEAGQPVPGFAVALCKA